MRSSAWAAACAVWFLVSCVQPADAAPAGLGGIMDECGSLDFDTELDGGALSAGDVLEDVFAPMTIRAWEDPSRTIPTLPVAFDTEAPSGGDDDLADSLGLVLIAQETFTAAEAVAGRVAEPDDRGRGSFLELEFPEPACIGRVGLLDIDTSETARLEVRDATGALVASASAPANGDGARTSADLGGACGTLLTVELSGSGAVTSVDICPPEEVCSALLADTFERPNGDLVRTPLDAPAGTVWRRPSGATNTMNIEGGGIVAVPDGPYASTYHADQGAPLSFENLRARFAFELQTEEANAGAVGVAINSRFQGANPGGIQMSYVPYRGGELRLGQRMGNNVPPTVSLLLTGLDHRVEPNVRYFMELDFDASGTNAVLRLTSGDYHSNGGTVLGEVSGGGFDPSLTPSQYTHVNNWASTGLTTSRIEEVFVERCE